MTCAYQKCSRSFESKRSWSRYCCPGCRRNAWRQTQREKYAKERALHPKPPPRVRPKRKRLMCNFCGMAHATDRCRRVREPVKQFGTVVNGEYVPPEGVKVRMLQIPRTVHGDTLGRLLKEMGK